MSDAAPLILIVDDDDSAREILAEVLAEEGYVTQTARDGVDALERLRAGLRPALMLMDLMMPRLDGEGLVLAMRADPQLANIPVIVISGHTATKSKAAALAARACLVKPIDLDDLLAAVQSVQATAG